jgi:hypothetical protein
LRRFDSRRLHRHRIYASHDAPTVRLADQGHHWRLVGDVSAVPLTTPPRRPPRIDVRAARSGSSGRSGSKEEMIMTRTHTRLPLLVALVGGVLALPLTAPAADPPIVQLATGSGHFQYPSPTGGTALRTFSFEARKYSDGTVSGNAQVKNRATDQTLNIHIDCLNVLGNIAVVSGIAWSATGPGNTNGDDAIFAVEDNGQGAAAAPDKVTYAYTGTGLVCSGVHSPADLDPSLFYDVEGGNIAVH